MRKASIGQEVSKASRRQRGWRWLSGHGGGKLSDGSGRRSGIDVGGIAPPAGGRTEWLPARPEKPDRLTLSLRKEPSFSFRTGLAAGACSPRNAPLKTSPVTAVYREETDPV